MKVVINGEEKKIASPSRILNLIDNKNYRYYAARVNNRLRELNYIVSNDCEIELLDLNDSEVSRMYQATLRYVIAYACKRVYPNARISYNYSVSRSIFASVSGLGHPFLEKNLKEISNEVYRIIASDLPINRYSVTKEEAIEYYKSIGLNDKVKVLKYRPEDTVHMYQC